MDNSQIINKYDSIIDIMFIRTKYTTKVEIVLTKFDVEFPEKGFLMDDSQRINKYYSILDVIFDLNIYEIDEK